MTTVAAITYNRSEAILKRYPIHNYYFKDPMIPLKLVFTHLALCLLMLQANAAEQEISIPLILKDAFNETRLKLAATEFRPDGPGPFPLAIINHGSPRLPAERANTSGRYKVQS